MDTTTYPKSTTPEELATHAEYLELERQGKVTRYLDHDGVNHPHGAPFIIWRSIDGPPVQPPPVEPPPE